jgi:hypothetical protein
MLLVWLLLAELLLRLFAELLLLLLSGLLLLLAGLLLMLAGLLLLFAGLLLLLAGLLSLLLEWLLLLAWLMLLQLPCWRWQSCYYCCRPSCCRFLLGQLLPVWMLLLYGSCFPFCHAGLALLCFYSSRLRTF